eukprot:scaffold23765_cov35-Cyclotella_meneghiniana.AAC.4
MDTIELWVHLNQHKGGSLGELVISLVIGLFGVWWKLKDLGESFENPIRLDLCTADSDKKG